MLNQIEPKSDSQITKKHPAEAGCFGDQSTEGIEPIE